MTQLETIIQLLKLVGGLIIIWMLYRIEKRLKK